MREPAMAVLTQVSGRRMSTYSNWSEYAKCA